MNHATLSLADEHAFRRKWGPLLASIPILLVILGCWFFAKERPPAGREVQFWILRLEGPQVELARQELLGIGAQALPILSEHSVLGRSHAHPNSAYATMWLQSPAWSHKVLPYPKEFKANHFGAQGIDFVAHEILEHLQANGSKAASALPVLDELAGNTNSPYQLKAGFAAWTIRGQRGELVPLLSAKLRQASSRELLEAASLSSFLGERAAPLTGEFARLLTHTDIDVARSAASALGHIGPGARAAAPALLIAANSSDQRLRTIARGALERIDAEAHRDLLENDSRK